MRSFHFIEENDQVDEEIAALKTKDFPTFLRLITTSGNSSWNWLQNVYVPSDCVKPQSVSVCLALTEIFLRQNKLEGKTACRIHGGGFAGVIQVFLPVEKAEFYKQWIDNALQPAKEAVFVMSIRSCGVVQCL